MVPTNRFLVLKCELTLVGLESGGFLRTTEDGFKSSASSASLRYAAAWTNLIYDHRRCIYFVSYLSMQYALQVSVFASQAIKTRFIAR